LQGIFKTMKRLIEDLQWRYAVKKYDTNKKIPAEIIEHFKDVLRLVPTSNGLQPYKFLIIETPEIRQELRKHSFNQPQITDASHLFVFCSYKTLNETHYDDYIYLNSVIRETPMEQLSTYAFHLKASLMNRTEDQILNSNEKQCYIALGQLLQTAAIHRVDASPMEGFIASKYDEVLGLPAKNLTATVVCALGYRSEEDIFQHWKKVRKNKEDLFEII